MRLLSAILAVLVLTAAAAAQELVSFPTEDGGVVYADVYGRGERGVVLAHGGPFTKESWAKQAPVLVKAGFRVVAIDFRGRGRSRGGARASSSSLSLSSSSSSSSDEGYRFDVLAAVRYLRSKGAKSVSVVGASFGADAAAEAAVTRPGEIDCLVLLAGGEVDRPELIKGRKLFVVARGDLGPGDLPRLPKIRAVYEKAPGPKELVVLEGSAHAQFIFETDQGERLMREIVRFLEEK